MWNPETPENVAHGLQRVLTYAGSMTEILKQCAETVSDQFLVNLLHEHADVMLPYELRSLMTIDELCQLREVHLCVAGKPYIYAQTYFPLSTLNDPRTQLKGLNSRPLGEVLFNNPSTTRSEFEYCTLVPGDELFEQAFQTLSYDERPDELFARRSVFHIEGHPLAVVEVFMPDFVSYFDNYEVESGVKGHDVWRASV